MGATRESPSLDDAANDSAELAELRRRAYGPGADIFEDSSALARLIELERNRVGASGTPVLDPEMVTADEPAVPPPAPGAEVSSAGRRAPRRAAALIATAAAAILVIATVASAVRANSSEATLYPRNEVSAAAAEQLAGAGDLRYLGIDRADVRLYDDFRGLNVWSARRGPQTICLFLTSSSPRTWRVDCTPLDRTPTITLTRYRDSLILPGGEPFRDGPVGTTIHFVLRDGAVHALVELPDVDATAP
jgi:hypothetical protein